MRSFHTKPMLLALSSAWLAGCNHLAAKDSPADAGASATASTAGTSATGPSIGDKALSLVSGGPFEGEITMNISRTEGPPIVITFELSGSKARFTQSPPIGKSSYSIVDYGTKKIVTVFDAKKLAVPMDLDDLNGVVAGVAKRHAGTATATGKTNVVAGYSCDVYQATEENGDKHDACLAKGIRVPLLGASIQWMASTFGGDGDWIPMRNVTTDKTGKEKSHMEVTKVDKKAVDGSRFVVPAGYRTETFQEMETGLQAR